MKFDGENPNLSLKGLQNITFTNPDTKPTTQAIISENSGPRSFTMNQKEECWNRAQIMIGRNPERWRLDAVGNPVFKYLKGCEGPLCHEYDHIIPWSKGGKTVVENCQILQRKVNGFKSNKIDVTYEELRKASPTIRFSDIQLDAIELAAYGDVKRGSLQDIVDRQKIEIQSSNSGTAEQKPKPKYERRERKEKTNTEKISNQETQTPSPSQENN